MTNHIRSGFKFTNEDMEHTVILCDVIERKNVA